MLFMPCAMAVGHVAQIVSIQGKGDTKGFGDKEWKPVVVQQELDSGNFVRTGDMSNMALLFTDQTQVRLNQNSQLQIKTVADSGDSNTQTAVKLNAGRAWGQTKNVNNKITTGVSTAPGPGRLTMETPTATMSIRGTDWDVEVGDEGKSTLTVLSGYIEFSNDYGSVTVNKGEQAVAERGKAPIKILISNPKERVQWVNSYEVDPLRYIRLTQVEDLSALEKLRGTGAGAAPAQPGAALYDLQRRKEAKEAFGQALSINGNDTLAAAGMALLALHEKDVEGAAHWLKTLTRGELAGLSQAAFLVRSGEMRAASNLLEKMVAAGTPHQPAAHLILADFLVSQGHLKEAIEADRKTLGLFPNAAIVHAHLSKLHLLADQGPESAAQAQAAIDTSPGATESYLAQAEHAKWDGDAKIAEASYAKAAQLNPADDRGWFGLGAVHGEKDDFRRGRENLSKAIELNPDGPGYQGELGNVETLANNFDAARDSFDQALKRNPDDYVALTGNGVMLLKRGETDAALQMFLKAGVMEPRYARAHLYTGVAYYQLGRTTRALEEINKARELDPRDPMPSMIASMIHNDYFDPAKAIEESRNANRLMPYLKSMNQLANNQKGVANVGNALSLWGLRDWSMHYAQNSNYAYWAGSHLFLSNMYSGKYAKNSELFQGYITDPTIFGASNRFTNLIHRPGNYQTYTMTAARDGDIVNYIPKITLNGYNNSYIPVSYFLDAEDKITGNRSGTDFGYSDETRSFTGALGVMPTSELRLFAYASRVFTRSNYRNPSVSNLDFNLRTGEFAGGASYAFTPTNMLRLKYSNDQVHGDQSYFNNIAGLPTTNNFGDKQLSHNYQMSWQSKVGSKLEIHTGIEHATSPESSFLTLTDTNTFALRYDDRSRLREYTSLGYLSSKFFFLGRSYLQFDAVYTDYEKTVSGGFTNNFNGTSAAVYQRFLVQKFSPRVGVAWEVNDDHTLRLAYQNWVRPSSASTLGPVATAGIPLEENLARFGGTVDRYVAVLESEWTPTFYTELSFDRKKSKNIGTYDLSLAEAFANLSKLRQISQLDVVSSQAGQSNAEYTNLNLSQSADVTHYRVTANKILTSTLSTTASYINTQSDIWVPDLPKYYLPNHQAILGATWVSPMRVRIGVDLNWRSKANTFLGNYQPYLGTNFFAYWETNDKHVSLSGFVRDAFSPHDSTYYGVTAVYRY
jgi:tetratricopeptide (TPR) repeat protein